MKLLIAFFLMAGATAQGQTLSITYDPDKVAPTNVLDSLLKKVNDNFYVVKVRIPRIKMVLNDSFALAYIYYNDDANKRKKIMGDKLIHHAVFSDYVGGKMYDEVNYPTNTKYLIYDQEKFSYKWALLTGVKTILGYKCHEALAVNKNGDSTLLWYTTDLKYKKGGLFYGNVPGVVLEAYEQNEVTSHFTAVSIKEEKIKLVNLKEGQIITLKEFLKINATHK